MGENIFRKSPMFLFRIPIKSIKEVYLGVNVYSRNVAQLNKFSGEYFSELVKSWQALDIKVYHTEPMFEKWGLKTRA